MTDTNQSAKPTGQYSLVDSLGPRHKWAAEIHKIAMLKCEACGDALVPAGDPFVEFDLAGWQTFSCVIEPVDDGADWRYVSVGDKLVEFFKVDATGRLVSDIYDPRKAKDGIALLNTVAKPPYRPHYFRLVYNSETMEETVTDNIFVPVPATEGDGVRVLGFTLFGD